MVKPIQSQEKFTLILRTPILKKKMVATVGMIGEKREESILLNSLN